jgi:hypothetical protein
MAITGCVARTDPETPPTGWVVSTNCVAVPATKFTVAVPVNALPPKVPLTVDVPAVVADVNVAVYVPLLLSLTEPKVPNVGLKTTTPPEAVKLFPFESFNCTVIVEMLVPFAVIELGEALIVDWVSDAAPTTVVILAVVPV